MQQMFICSVFSRIVRVCEKLCLQSLLEYWQWWWRRDEKKLTVPAACHRNWKRAVTDRRVRRSRKNKRRHVCWLMPPSRIVIGDATDFAWDVRWCTSMLTAKSKHCKTVRYSLRRSRKGVTWPYFHDRYIIHTVACSIDFSRLSSVLGRVARVTLP